MLRTALISLALASASSASAFAMNGDSRLPIADSRSLRGPGVRVWTSSGDLFRRNERVRVYYRTERDAYVTVLRVDTDGRVRVLFPRHPMEDNFAAAGHSYSVSNWDRGTAFVVDDYPGVGYIFAIASSDPFDYRPIQDGDRWSLYRVSDGRIHGDPRATLEEMMFELLPTDYDGWDTHIAAYHVERRYDYPRFVCYDCHSYVPFYSWNPYHNWCRRYTLVVWNDPWYYHPSYWYPTRHYGGRRVVYTYPGAPARYVFKESEGNGGGGVDYRRRDVATYVRRPDDRGVRATDIGGVGTVAAPGTSGRRYSGSQPEPRGEDRPRIEDRPRGEDRPRVNDGGGRRGIEIVPEPRRTPSERPSERPQADPEARRTPSERPSERPQAMPESRRTPSERPQAERPQAERPQTERPQTERPQPRPEASRPAPETRTPERARPEARPQSPPPQSRPERAAPQSRPAERSQPQSRPERSQPSQGSSGRRQP